MKMKVKNFAALTDAPTVLEEKNREVAYRAALEGIVLLENDGALPLAPGKLALYGAGAGMTIKGGTGSGEVNDRHAVTILEGLEAAGFTVTTRGWLDEYARIYAAGEEAYGREFRKRLLHLNLANLANLMNNPYSHPFGQAVTPEDIRASATDTCLYVIARQAGEGADRRPDGAENSLSEQERANIALCAASYAKMIVVINTGSSFDMSFLEEIPGINAVIFFAQQGSMGGSAFADLVRGAETPSGKLTSTWARRYEDIPFAQDYSFLNGNADEEDYREGIYVGYRYFDSFGVAPRYPFGFGRSYTEFAIQTDEVAVEKTRVTVRATVTNVGRFAGREVLQLYVSCPQSQALPKELQQLAAFAKTGKLTPGASEMLTLQFDLADVASFREADAATFLEAGDYILRLGNSSRDTTICGVVTLDSEAIVSYHEHICPVQAPVEELAPPTILPPEIGPDVPRLVVRATDIATTTFTYEAPPLCVGPDLEKRLAALSLNERIELCVGDGMPVMKQSVKRYFEAPGTVGLTTPNLQHKNIPNVCMADGPAGLRLLKTSAQTKKGTIKQIDPHMQFMKYFPGFIKKFMFGDPARDTLLYQFTTAFPVAVAQAQTWNVDLLEEIGRAVSAEMTAYGISYWLAPAMNIHRNPLCGRNFEYYSEDPLLSGKLAAAVTRGVQSEPGNYVTLKHFACNNQEEHRNTTSANLNERALREIYLRGFGIAVREARPGAIMTSYNKINGTYAANNYDLLTKLLRNEWGFDRMVMTDWMATGKTLADAGLALAAGNDLIMPGGAGDKKMIQAALKSGALQPDDVRRCAANVLQGVLDTKICRMWEAEQGRR